MYAVLYSAYDDGGKVSYKLEGPYTKHMAKMVIRYFDEEEFETAEVVSIEQAKG